MSASTELATNLSKLSLGDIFGETNQLGNKIEKGEEVPPADRARLASLMREVHGRHKQALAKIDEEYGGDARDGGRKAEIDGWLATIGPVLNYINAKAALWGFTVSIENRDEAVADGQASGADEAGVQVETGAAAAAVAQQARAELAGKLEPQIDALRKQQDESNTKIAELQAEVSQIQADKAQLIGEKSALQAQNTQLATEKAALGARVQTLETEKASEKQTVNSLLEAKDRSISALQQQLRGLGADLERKSAQIDAAQATELAIQQALESAGILLSPGQSPLDGLLGLVQKAKLADTQQAELTTNAQALAQLNGQLAQAQATTETAHASLAEKNRASAAQAEKITEQAQVIATLQEQITHLETNKKQQADQLAEKSRAAGELTERIALLEAELASQKALITHDTTNAEQKDQAVPKLESLIEVSKEKLATLLKIDQDKVALILNNLFIPYIKANGQIPRSRINQMTVVPEKDLVASGQWDSLKTNTITVLFGEIVKSIVLPANPNFLEKDAVHAFLRTATNNPDIIAFKKGVLKIIIQQPN